ncbi:PREDICTED: toll/interleukin-1 receptor-like protein [Prunus mume]|uniref:ADP-ribosyl cyclase/cyclic ADP-ribose hydrolase n=1 Tax=Prunus mume TaxID=102107 RepID=A0ABM1LQQ0_PRUMU|nr:PREDICTED: toll/interleukin-1 receptor-like protein [Prunus mume]
MALVRAADPQTSSVSSTSGYYRYHVFLSFRGQDTRKTFTDHLYTALVNAGFRTFRDYDEVERGEGIKPELQKAIKHSRTSVIVFSKDYASSRWCLDELVMILERKRKTSDDHVVLPVFYDVYPSHVKKQTGSLAKAFARHQKTQPLPKVKAWREALAEVADLAGMVLQNQAHG